VVGSRARKFLQLDVEICWCRASLISSLLTPPPSSLRRSPVPRRPGSHGPEETGLRREDDRVLMPVGGESAACSASRSYKTEKKDFFGVPPRSSVGKISFHLFWWAFSRRQHGSGEAISTSRAFLNPRWGAPTHLVQKRPDRPWSGDALAAERRRMPWMAVEKAYSFEGPAGKASLLDLFDGQHQPRLPRLLHGGRPGRPRRPPERP
jgi:Bacterial protein of unknown function (DUF899)